MVKNPVWRQVRRNRLAVLGLAILCTLVLIAIAAPRLAPCDPYEMNLRAALQPPGTQGEPGTPGVAGTPAQPGTPGVAGTPAHLLGTDELGRDNLSRLIYGSRISLQVGLVVVSIAGLVGVTLGTVSGYFGGAVDDAIMRLADVVLAFPFLVLAIAVVAVVGPGLTNMMIVLGGVSWASYARLVRGVVLGLREEDYVLAARVLGAGDRHIIWRHILPNCLGVVIVQATFGVAHGILAASGLSFLGLGAQPPEAEWGAMLSAAKPYLRQRPLMSIAPGLAIMITVLAINLVGDALRDALDPRLRSTS